MVLSTNSYSNNCNEQNQSIYQKPRCIDIVKDVYSCEKDYYKTEDFYAEDLQDIIKKYDSIYDLTDIARSAILKENSRMYNRRI